METDTVMEDQTDITPEPNPYIPEARKNWVHFGNSDVLRKIVKSGIFYTTYVVGQQGAGKTELILQLHAEEKKPVILVSITPETDEDDLIGSISLTTDPVSGQTITGWEDGPVLIAMKNGYSLILDEVDTGGNLQSLFPVLTGQSVFVKRIKQRIVPAPGFNVFATANTNGKGSVDGRFTSAKTQSVAFVDRFSAMIEQDYPDEATEVKILMGSLGMLDKFAVAFNEKELLKLIKLLCQWAAKIREGFKGGSLDETMSTRKLISILNGLAVFESFESALTVNLNSLDADTAKAFKSLFDKLSPVEIKELDKRLFAPNAPAAFEPPPAPPAPAEPVNVEDVDITNLPSGSTKATTNTSAPYVPPKSNQKETKNPLYVGTNVEYDKNGYPTDAAAYKPDEKDEPVNTPAPTTKKKTSYYVV